MTVNKDQVQHLIAEINEVLSLPTSRLPWGNGSQGLRQRQMLEQVRYFLEALLQTSPQITDSAETQAQDVMQSVIQEINSLRSTVLRPLHTEVATLMQQRNALVREIRQLEAHRQLLEQPIPQAASEPPSLEKLQVVHDRADQVLSTLDTTLSVVFQSLQKDIQSYQDSLSQGIEKLHSLGCQSEAMFSGLVGRLAEQLGRDASTYLQSQNSLPTEGSVMPPILAGVDIAMPYAGTELASSEAKQNTTAIDTINSLSDLIDQLAIEVEEVPITVPAMPPQNGFKTGIESPPELRSLFYTDDPAEPITSFAETAYTPEENLLPEQSPPSTLDMRFNEAILSQLSEDLSTLNERSASNRSLQSIPTAPPHARSIFTLDGMDEIFVEDTQNDSKLDK